ncbi:MAG: DUF72 domain-containing protein [Candidatus Dormibacteria bacterium]
MAGTLAVGTCNWSDHQNFYPAGLPAGERLAYYARFFPLVEVDSSYYAIPSPVRTSAWAQRTPADFRFNIKAYRALTYHQREAGAPREPTEAEEQGFLAALVPLRESGKLKAVHYQFPSWFTASPLNLIRLARLRERHPDDLVVVEFRHRSWADPQRLPQLLELLQEARLSLCAVDEPQLGSGSFPTLLDVTDRRLVAVRFHGRNRQAWYRGGASSADRFDYLYSEDELREWVDPIRRLTEEAGEVQLLFNNNRADYAVVNGLQLAHLLGLEYPSPGLPLTEVAEPRLPYSEERGR